MTLNRIDVVLVAALVLQTQLLLTLYRQLGFGVLHEASLFASLASVVIAALFLSGVFSALAGIQNALQGFWKTGDERLTSARHATFGVLITAALLSFMFIVSQVYQTY
jgi:succinate dehydrogenase/fumarate reductase cytochrome b subunit